MREHYDFATMPGKRNPYIKQHKSPVSHWFQDDLSHTRNTLGWTPLACRNDPFVL
jgi:hypothetical protein